MLCLSVLPRGLWEDGYFVIRFAYNFRHHGTFAWNPSDGPVYGMTSQTLQLLGALLYVLDPAHVATWLRVVLSGALFCALLVIGRTLAADANHPLRLLPAAAGLSLPLLLELVPSGLETALAILAVALAIHATLELAAGRGGLIAVVLSQLVLYWTRPDALLIPLALLALLGGTFRRRALQAAGLIALGLSLSWLIFYAYYGTALPLPFYIKTRGFSVQTAAHLAIFAPEKTKNALQAAFFALPFVYVALHERTRRSCALLASGAALAGYHYLATVETMGHLSRFYLPALVPIWIAAALAYPSFLRGRRLGLTLGLLALYLALYVALARLDSARRIDIMLPHVHFYPYLVTCCVMLLAPRGPPLRAALLLGATLWLSGAWMYPPRRPRLEGDRAILLRQIAPRRVFRGLPRLRERIDVHALFHTDMGAPGVLFPEARVVDLDGLLNEAVTLHGARFATLCERDRPEAILVPNESYPELRREVLESDCLRHYRPVDADPSSPLRVREDLLARYLGD
jgi:hypothetical protein